MYDPVSFIPVSRIIAHCAIAYDTLYRFELEEHRVCISVPLIKKNWLTQLHCKHINSIILMN